MAFLMVSILVMTFIILGFGIVYLMSLLNDKLSTANNPPEGETPFQKRMKEYRELDIMNRHIKLQELENFKKQHPELFGSS